MYTYEYPHPAVTADCVVFGYEKGNIKVLLIERGNDPYKGRWAFPGGFINIDEAAYDGVLRELKEETGLEVPHVEQFHTFSAPYRDPRERVITVAYFALAKITEVIGGDDATKAHWFCINEVPPLAFDHDRMLEMALSKLREHVHFRPVGLGVMPEKFTLGELRQLYEAIVGKTLDKRTFANEMLSLGILSPSPQPSLPDGDEHDPLYAFNAAAYTDCLHNGFHAPLRL